MSIRRLFLFSLFIIVFLVPTGLPKKKHFSHGKKCATQDVIAGRNINMVSGTTLPLGDPFLQRQNEPSIAVSSRNPLHLFAAANDYRTIDVPDDYRLPGIEGASSSYRDAWIGVFESFDGGESWITGLLPGFPQDGSSEALASPIHTFDTACDPKVVAGAEGLFYLCGITFNRNQQGGGVFVSRYVDFNDRENVVEEFDDVGHRKFKGPIRYVDTRLVDRNTPRRFIDMPNIAVDVPRGGKCYGGRRYGTVYVAYTVFLGNNPNITRSRILLKRSTDGGATWSGPTILSEFQGLVQRPVIVIDPSDPTGRTVYVVFRRFSFRRKPDAILFVKSRNGGKRFSHPRKIATLHCPFDQWTKGDGTITSHRTNSYPTMAVEVVNAKGIPYVVWAQRYDQNGNLDPDGQARIVFSYSRNRGFTWSEPQLVDPYYVGGGHQFMPSITCAGGNKTVIWYDQRDDIALHDPYVPHDPYEKFMEDIKPLHRHTIDVRAAEAPIGSHIFEPSILLSRYLFFMQLNENGEPYMDGGELLLWQGEFNFTGLPLFHLGTKPFQGDYIQVVSSPNILPPPAPGSNSWAFNTDPSEPTRAHGVWSDTRDVWPPGGDLWGDWITYNPPNSVQDPDFAQEYPCAHIDTTGMRNQNIYTADLNHGVIVGSPTNTKQLDIKRSFVVFVKDTIGYNDTNGVQDRTFHLSLQEVGGVNASFDQLVDDDSLVIAVPPHSSVSSTVYVDQSQNLFAPVIVNVEENGTLVGRVYLNPDSTNNPIPDLGDERHDASMGNPRTWRYGVGNQDEPNSVFLSPRAQNPRAQNSGYVNPRAQNPRAQNPRAQNPRAQNPRAQNENIVNNSMYNPRAQNPRAQNTALADTTWTVTNEGNTTSAYSFDIVADDPAIQNLFNQEDPPLIAQVLVYKSHMVPIDNGCVLFETHADQLMVNVPNPRAQNPRAQNVAPTSGSLTMRALSAHEDDFDAQDITFNLAPGESADIIFRVYDPIANDDDSIDDYINDIAGETEAEAINTEDEGVPGATPVLVTQPSVPWGPDQEFLPEISNSPASFSSTAVLGTDPDDQDLTIWNTGGGTLNYMITTDAGWLSIPDPDGTSHEPGEGYDYEDHDISVDTSGLAVGTYQGMITITDPNATNNPVRLPVTLTIAVAPPAATITGTVKYNEFPVTNYTNKTVDFWARDETTGKSFSISPTYDNTSGTYSIPNMPSGTYGIRVNVDDAEPLDGKNFPGDYYGWTSPIEVKEGDTVVNVDLDCQKIMHLTAPIDNLNEQHWAGPDYDTWQSPITFDWDAISEASTYKYRVAKYQSNPYQYIETVVSTTETSNTQADITLAESSVNQHYQFYLYAYSADDVDVMVGRFMIVYNGHGWDYRFRVIEGCGVAGDMYYSRAHHRATRLQDGRVLITGGQGVITGGQGGSGYLESVEIYNSCFPWGGLINPNIENPNILNPNILNPIHFMEFEHSEHTATLLSDGKVLVVGGYGTGYSEAEIYDPDTHLFSRTTNAPFPRTQHTATLLEDHNVLIVGGFGAGSTVEIFDPGTDPASDTFTQITGPDRYHHTATLLKDGKVLIVGGRDSSNNPLDSAVIYDPGSGFSSVGDTMSVARHNHSATLLPDGKVLIAGGTDYNAGSGGPHNTAEIFDPEWNTFETPITMVSTRAAHTATLLDDETVLLVGGNSPGTTEIYYPSTGRFRSAGSMTTSRSRHTATILLDGTVLITGGNPGNELNSAEIFYPIALTTYLYGVNSIDEGLSIIDPDSGLVTFISLLDPDHNTFTTPIAMAVQPTDGKIFVWNNSDPAGVLLAVDPCKGAATKVDPTAEDQGTLHALAFASDGKLFGVSNFLCEIDTISGVKSVIGNWNLGLRAAFGADFDANGVLYAITHDYDYPNALKELITIDTITGQGSIVATLSEDIGVPGSIVFDATGKLIGSGFGFGGSEGHILFDIDPADGTVSNIRTLSGGFYPQGMGFAPRKKLY